MLETSISIAMVVGLTEVVKRAGKISSRFAPLLSLLFGIGIMFLGDMPLKETLIAGITIGLMSSGLYSGSKALIKG